VCQVCNKAGHIALDCYQRFNTSFQRDSPPNPHAFMASPQALADQTCWYPDSGHITSDLANLNLKTEEYTGSDQLRVGNGTGLSFHHIGNAQLSTPTLPFTLYNVLHVPHITKNLLSVHYFTKATNTYFEFHPFHFLMKDRATGKTLLRGRSDRGLYSFPSFPAFNNSPQPAAMVGERTSVSGWHSRLGHPAFRVLRPLLYKFQLPFLPNKDPPTCAACFSSKSHQQPFSHSHTRSLGPLDLVYTDVWGPSQFVLYLVSSTTCLSLMILEDIPGFFQLLVKVMSLLFSINLSFMLNATSLVPLNLYNLIGVANIAPFPKFPNTMASLIAFLAPTLTNKMVLLNVNTITLSKPVLPYYPLLAFLVNIGMMPLSLHAA